MSDAVVKAVADAIKAQFGFDITLGDFTARALARAAIRAYCDALAAEGLPDPGSGRPDIDMLADMLAVEAEAEEEEADPGTGQPSTPERFEDLAGELWGENGEPSFTLRARDPLAPVALRAYAVEARKCGYHALASKSEVWAVHMGLWASPGAVRSDGEAAAERERCARIAEQLDCPHIAAAIRAPDPNPTGGEG